MDEQVAALLAKLIEKVERLDRDSHKQTMNRREAAHYLNISEHKLRQHELLGTGPKYFEDGKRKRYPRSNLDDWPESCANESSAPASPTRGRPRTYPRASRTPPPNDQADTAA